MWWIGTQLMIVKDGNLHEPRGVRAMGFGKVAGKLSGWWVRHLGMQLLRDNVYIFLQFSAKIWNWGFERWLKRISAVFLVVPPVVRRDVRRFAPRFWELQEQNAPRTGSEPSDIIPNNTRNNPKIHRRAIWNNYTKKHRHSSDAYNDNGWKCTASSSALLLGTVCTEWI